MPPNRLTRRQFLTSGLGFSGLLAAGLSPLVARSAPSSSVDTASAGTAKWAMLIDATRFTDTQLASRIAASCHAFHNVPRIPQKAPGKSRSIEWMRSVSLAEAFPEPETPKLPAALHALALPVLCNHCENPPCVRVCPTGATFQGADGRVGMDAHRCIGCRFCMAACPYGARSFNFCDPSPFVEQRNPNYPLRMQGVVEKCTFCPERTVQNTLPPCVEASEGALVFGNLLDKQSQLYATFQSTTAWTRKSYLGTNPSVYYTFTRLHP